MSDIMQRLDRLRIKLQDDDFLHGRGLANEVNISIFCYEPKEEMAIRHFVAQMVNDSSIKAKCNLMECNLYSIFLSICDDEEITDQVAGIEAEDGCDYVLEHLQRTADNKTFVQKMQYDNHKIGDVLLLTGIGEVYPFMRVHSLLEVIQTEFSDIPVVVMYPGKFDGLNLKLFSQFEPNSYYRAFNII